MKKYAIYAQFKCSSYLMVHVELVDSDIIKEQLIQQYLAGVLASLEESSTEHVGGDLSRVGFLAAAVAQDGGIQTHQEVRVVVWNRKRKYQ